MLPLVRKDGNIAAPRNELFDHSGLLATAGGVVFGLSGGVLFALDCCNRAGALACVAWRKHCSSPDLLYVGWATGDRCVGGPGTYCVWFVGQGASIAGRLERYLISGFARRININANDKLVV